ncbi:54S ribosomal protein L23, mitochondrial [Hanseniaspora osmophila]
MSQKFGHTGLAFARVWHLVDIAKEERSLGRLASQIAITLCGKHKPIYHPTQDVGDYVVVSNCQDLRITGKKFEQKTYWRHSGKPGNLKLLTMKEMAERKGYGELLRKAVSGMLPKNKLRKTRLARLKVFDGSEHPYKQNIVAHVDQQPTIMEQLQEIEN